MLSLMYNNFTKNDLNTMDFFPAAIQCNNSDLVLAIAEATDFHKIKFEVLEFNN